MTGVSDLVRIFQAIHAAGGRRRDRQGARHRGGREGLAIAETIVIFAKMHMALSNFNEVVVGARISRSGQAMPQSGDFEGLSPPVKVGARNVAVVIESTLP